MRSIQSNAMHCLGSYDRGEESASNSASPLRLGEHDRPKPSTSAVKGKRTTRCAIPSWKN